MADFDFDKYEKKEGDFDFDKYEQTRPMDTGNVAIHQTLRGLTGNLSDEAAGVVEAGGRVLGLEGVGQTFGDVKMSEDGPTLDWDTLKEAYEMARNKKRDLYHQQEKESPTASNLYQLSGAIASPLNKLTKGLSMAKGGAVLGGINALGASEAESPIGVAKDTALGVGLGYGLGYGADKIAPYIEKGVSSVGGKIKDFAEKRAFKSLGPYQRDMLKAYSKDQVNSIGRTALDEGVVGGIPTSYTGLAHRAETALQNKGEALGSYVDDLAAAESRLKSVGTKDLPDFKAGIDRGQIAQSMRNDLLNSNTDIPGVAAKNVKIEKLIKQFESGDDSLLDLLKSENLKKSVGKEIKWDRLPGADIPIEEQVQRSLYTKLKVAGEDYAEALDKTVGGPSASGFKNLKSQYGDLSTAAKISSTREAKEAANRMISPSDYMTGIGGIGLSVATGNPLPALAGVANNLGRKYGNQVMATGANNISKALLKSPQMLNAYQKNPALFQSLANKLEQKYGLIETNKENQSQAPQDQNSSRLDKDSIMNKVQGTKYQQVLQNAAQKGDQSFAAAHFVLQGRDQNYRKQLEDQNNK